MGVCEDIDSAWFETVSSTKQYLAIRKATESTVANNGWTQVPHIVLIRLLRYACLEMCMLTSGG